MTTPENGGAGTTTTAVKQVPDDMVSLDESLSPAEQVNSLLLGPDTSGLGPAVTVYASLWAVATLLQECRQMWQDIRSYFDDVWNLLELASPLLVGAGMVCHDFLDDADSARQLHSWAVLVLWLRLLEICERFESVGPLVSVIVRMLSDSQY
jgi:hypothetical protein